MLDLNTRLSRHEPTCPRAQGILKQENERTLERIQRLNREAVLKEDMRQLEAERDAHIREGEAIMAEAERKSMRCHQLAEQCSFNMALVRKEIAVLAGGE